MSLTRTGQHRADYAIAAKLQDPRPSMFTNNGDDYREWAKRADMALIWACCTSNIAPAQCLHYNRVA